MTTVVSARFKVHEDSWDDYLEAAKLIIPVTRQEDGCVHYGIAMDLIEDHVVWFTEEWESEEHLMVHLGQPHVSDFIAKATELQILDAEVKKYTVSEVGTIGV
tara:strand:- start:194 stop:502 length:309 start_codon:yes stop_codon:yes gene_type:complete